MTCHEARKWLSPYLDSELCATKTYEVSEHLRTCEACRARFDAERRTDSMVREHLAGGEMPPELWSRLQGFVNRPTTWIHRIGPVRGLAIAASLLIVAALAFYVIERQRTDDRPWIVAELAVLAPDGTVYASDEPSGVFSEEIFKDVLGVAIPRDALNGVSGHHPIQLVSMRARKDDAGRPFVELKMKCCGQAVLVLIARDGTALPDAFEGAPIDTPPPWTPDGVLVNARRFDGLVAVAASYHAVDPILDHLRISEA